MKITCILLTIIILSLTVYAAGQTLYIESPEITNEQAVKLGLNDRIEFEMLDGTHTIILDKINPKTGFVELDIFPYINKDPNERQVAYVSIDRTRFASLDLNRDYIYELEVRLISLDGATGAFLRIDKVYKPIFKDKIPEDKKEIPEDKKEDMITPIAITIIVFAIMFIIYLLIYKKPKV